MILIRESDLYVLYIPHIHTDHLILKIIDKCVGSYGKRIIRTLAALKSNTVNSSLKVNGGHILVLNGTVFNFYDTGISITGLFKLLVYLSFSDLSILLLNLYAFIFAKLYLRFNSYLGCEHKRLLLIHLNDLKRWLGNYLKIRFSLSLLVKLRYDLLRSFFMEKCLTVHLLDYLTGRLSLSEAGYADLTLVLVIRFLYALLKFLSCSLDGKAVHIFLAHLLDFNIHGRKVPP